MSAESPITAALNITLHSGNDREQATKEQLLRILNQYHFDGWLFTTEIRIQSMVQPHSHPVLTINTRQLDDDDGFLGTFLHEQFHWHAENELPTVEAVIAELRSIWPEVPVGPPQGARSEFSSYLHLIICLWELDALTQLIGLERATTVIRNRGYYTWNYQTILAHGDQIRTLLSWHNLVLPQPSPEFR